MERRAGFSYSGALSRLQLQWSAELATIFPLPTIFANTLSSIHCTRRACRYNTTHPSIKRLSLHQRINPLSLDGVITGLGYSDVRLALSALRGEADLDSGKSRLTVLYGTGYNISKLAYPSCNLSNPYRGHSPTWTVRSDC